MKFTVKLEEDDEIIFLDLAQVEDIHARCLQPQNLKGYLKRDDLESALKRPVNHHYFSNECDLIRLAAILWHGISEAHGFIDGNKRTGLLSAFVFLETNGIELDPSVMSEDPGVFTDACFRQNRFNIAVLDHYLRTHCRWISYDE
ncbi:type II toxin-antitoxin system death-on-curing family toxin [Amaricoccus tamworthensis]|uniref:type II toxin-antitoxin system death-on-curing family toxin n=1 Tax=Amaricoccus tamworthensis TaxID=57002 RepID=UPI003C7B6CD6